MSTYDSTKHDLPRLMDDVNSGKLQLPEFQRDWVWDDEHVRSLLASVTLSYPIGAVMTLQTGGEDVTFKTRPVEGSTPVNGDGPDWLILDGQQRLTALYQSLYSPKPVFTKDIRGKKVERHYHVNINAILAEDADREDALISVPADRIQKNFRGEIIADYSDTAKQCESEMLPIDIVLHTAKLSDWQMAYLQADPVLMAERLEKWNRLQDQVLKPIQQYQVPVIQLMKETPKVAVCQVFEKVNTGGVSLTVFELLTATFAAEGFDLRKDWDGRAKAFAEKPVLKVVKSDDFLQVISLLVTKKRRDDAIAGGRKPEQAPGISCKREAILRLSKSDYETWAETVQKGFVKAAKFLHLQKLFLARYLPYRTQVVPLAAIFCSLGEKAETDSARQLLARWYWCGVFGELYGSAIESRFAKDLPEFIAWLAGGSEPSTVSDSNFYATRLLTLRTRNSAAYKGLYVLQLRSGCQDFLSGDPIEAQDYFDELVDIHHIFPQHWCEKQGLRADIYNSIINKTALSARTNRKIGGRAPGDYLSSLEKEAGVDAERMDQILGSHVIDPVHIRENAFNDFFLSRGEALLVQIEKATGKSITREPLLDLPDAEDEVGPSAEELVAQGETGDLEFKSSLRVNLHSGSRDTRIELSVLKTLAAFLNTDGGVLIIGVADDGSPVGLDVDEFANEDKMALHLVNIVNTRMGPTIMTDVHTRFDDLDGQRVMVCQCGKASQAVFVKDEKMERFYVRTGPSTTELTPSQTQEYIKQRFN